MLFFHPTYETTSETVLFPRGGTVRGFVVDEHIYYLSNQRQGLETVCFQSLADAHIFLLAAVCSVDKEDLAWEYMEQAVIGNYSEVHHV